MRRGLVTRLGALLLSGCAGDDAEAPVCGPAPTGQAVPFVDATAELGITARHHFASDFCEIEDSVGGPGVCLLDHDGDGDQDIYFVDRAPHANSLYRNDGAVFTDVTEATGTGSTGDSVGCVAFDAEGDGDLDLYVTASDADILYRNDGGVFTDATAASGIVAEGFSTSATAGDIDGDGDLDLFVARLVDASSCPPMCHLLPLACPAQRNLLFINEGGHFVESAEARGLVEEEPSLAALFFDKDDDGDLDLYVGNDVGVAYPDRLYINDGKGFFTDRGDALGFAAAGTDTMGVAVGDYDADGLVEVVTTDFKDKPVRLYDCYDPALACSFESAGPESLAYVKWAVGLHDFDQDRDLDLFWTTGDVYYRDGEPNQLAWSSNGLFLSYVPAEGEALALKQTSRGAAFGDLDGDGDIDVVVANADGQAQVLRNQAATGHWLTVALDSRSAGARVTVTAGGATVSAQALIGGGYLGSSDPRVHFGLGDACSADVQVRWPNGDVTALVGQAVDRVLVIAR